MSVFLATIIIVLSYLLWRQSVQASAAQQQSTDLESRAVEAEAAYDLAQDELIRLNKQLVEVANIDPLTELLNRRAGESVLKAMFDRARRDHKSFAVALIDIDDFKDFNEIHGHDLGDQVLSALSESLGQFVRPTDKLVRWSGQEFLILFHHIDQDTALQVCQRISTDLKNTTDEPLRLITVSVGVTVWREGVTTHQMLKWADAAVIEAKRQGKDRVILSAATKVT